LRDPDRRAGAARLALEGTQIAIRLMRRLDARKRSGSAALQAGRTKLEHVELAWLARLHAETGQGGGVLFRLFEPEV